MPSWHSRAVEIQYSRNASCYNDFKPTYFVCISVRLLLICPFEYFERRAIDNVLRVPCFNKRPSAVSGMPPRPRTTSVPKFGKLHSPEGPPQNPVSAGTIGYLAGPLVSCQIRVLLNSCTNIGGLNPRSPQPRLLEPAPVAPARHRQPVAVDVNDLA